MGPPRNPVEGQRWRDGRAVYLWQAGKGWVGERFYQPLLPVGAGNEPEPDDEPEPVDAEQSARMAEAEAMMDAAPEPPRTVAPKAVNRCSCGAAIVRTSKRCRSCFAAERRSAKPKPQLTCCDCGGPRSLASKKRCKWCSQLAAAAARPPKPPPPAPPPRFRPDAAEVERVRRAVARIEAPPKPRAAPPPDETVEVSAPGFKAAPDPFAHRERAPKADPGFSPEFRLQLERVRAGAGIVAVQPIPRRGVPAMPGGGSSLAGAD